MSDEANRERYAVDLAYEHDLTLPQGRKLAELAIHALAPDFAPDSPLHLADPSVAEAYLTGPLGPYADDHSVSRLDDFARRAVEGGLETAGAWLVRARVAEHRGDLTAQRAHLEACLDCDADFGPALADLGFLAFVEGDTARARRLLLASGDERSEGMLHTLTHYPTRRSSVGRNERCPCGSGAKRKHCCADGPGHPLSHRAVWLWEKAGSWTRRMSQHLALMDVACLLAGVDDPDDDEPAVLAVLGLPILESLTLLDAGLLARFLERLGPVLPDDERALAGRWLGARHRVWRVESTTPGRSLVVTDLCDGSTIEATNGVVSRCMSPGEVVFAAVVPTGDGWLQPDHPVCLPPDLAAEAADLVAADCDPLAVAATLFEAARRARP